MALCDFLEEIFRHLIFLISHTFVLDFQYGIFNKSLIHRGGKFIFMNTLFQIFLPSDQILSSFPFPNGTVVKVIPLLSHSPE